MPYVGAESGNTDDHRNNPHPQQVGSVIIIFTRVDIRLMGLGRVVVVESTSQSRAMAPELLALVDLSVRTTTPLLGL